MRYTVSLCIFTTGGVLNLRFQVLISLTALNRQHFGIILKWVYTELFGWNYSVISLAFK